MAAIFCDHGEGIQREFAYVFTDADKSKDESSDRVAVDNGHFGNISSRNTEHSAQN